MALSLSMLKMEKNFIAVIEKNYPRQPYLEYPIYEPVFERGGIVRAKEMSLMGFVQREMKELDFAVEWAMYRERPIKPENLMKALKEIADVSNTLDFLFEALLEEYHSLKRV